jgi:hypothetical protein
MAYIDVITLAEAKTYLRIDDTLTEDDTQITRMINASLSYIERYTNVYVFARDKEFVVVNNCIRVYADPINTLVDPTDAESEIKTLYTTYTTGVDEDVLTLNVGHTLPADVPDELKEIALEMIDLMYYEHETGKSFTKDISSLSREILNSYKRFIV